MGLDDGPADGQADAHAVRLRGHEGLEELLGDLWGDAGSGIRHAHLDQALGGERPRGDGQVAPGDILHGLDRVADQVEQDLLHLDPDRHHEGRVRVEVEADAHALLLGADEGEGARFLDQLGQALDVPLALAARHEIPQVPDHLPGSQGLVGSLVHRVGEQGHLGTFHAPEEAAAAFQVARDRRQRLVDLVGQGRCHLAEGGEARHVHQLGLQLLQAGLGLVPLGEVADEAGEVALAARAHLADRQFHREGRAVLALPDHDSADADDPALTRHEVAGHVGVVLAAVRFRHQQADVPADHLVRAVAELAHGGRAERFDLRLLVDDDHRIGHRVEDRAQVGLARPQLLVGLLLLVDAENHAAVPARPTVGTDLHAPARAQPVNASVGMHGAEVDLVAPAVRQRPPDRRRPGGAIVRMHEGLRLGKGRETLRRHTEQADAGREDRDAPGRDVEGPAADAGFVERQPQAVRVERVAVARGGHVWGFRRRHVGRAGGRHRHPSRSSAPVLHRRLHRKTAGARGCPRSGLITARGAAG